MTHSPFVLILAGGSGERFWPLSRRSRPKQLLKLFSDKSLLEETIGRLSGFVPLDRILILTNQEQEGAVRAMCHQLPWDNIVAEPAKRDTAAAIALAVGWAARRDPTATMLVLPADHVIRDTAAFQRDLRAAAAAAESTGALVTIGIKPTWACPGFGYIELGERVTLSDVPEPAPAAAAVYPVAHPAAAPAVEGDGHDPLLYNVRRFREKPAPELAQVFFDQGGFRWNAGMFAWTLPAVLRELSAQIPALADFVSQARTTENFPALLEAKFPSLPKISIDYAIMENASHVLALEAQFDWDDVGSWTAAAKYLKMDEHQNAANLPLTTLDARENIVFSDGSGGSIALLGVSDLIVVQTADATLIAHRHEAERIKQLVAKVKPEMQ
jgi:mannose-1-phosphate guanylyltransferase